MKHGLRLGDYLDLEWFLDQDRHADSSQTLERDRQLGLAAASDGIPANRFFSYWLAQRRAGEKEVLPSALLRTVRTLTRWAVAALCLGSGISMIRALLLYSGVEPINISVFLLVAVVPQILLCVAALVVLGIKSRGDWSGFSLLFSCVRAWLGRGRSKAAGFMSIMLSGRGWAARMLAMDCLACMQLGGLCFALGCLTGFLLSVAVTDLAFGWQSTLQVGAQGMHALVSMLALPWSWMPASWGGAPSLAQIEGSRIVLKEGISTLVNADLAAWWPFLGFCLLVYAVVPRCILLAFADRRLRNMERVFMHPDVRRIVDRMSVPRLDSGMTKEAPPATLPLDELDAHNAVENVPAGHDRPRLGCVLLLPPELMDRIAGRDLAQLGRSVYGYAPGRVFWTDLEQDGISDVLKACSGLSWEGDHERYAVLVEGWQPPIRENLLALKQLGQDARQNRTLSLILAGRPLGDNWLTAPTQIERKAWIEAVERLDPLHIEIFGAGAA